MNRYENDIAVGGSRPPGAMDAGKRKRPRLKSETLDSSTMLSLLNGYRARRSRSTSLLDCIGRFMDRRTLPQPQMFPPPCVGGYEAYKTSASEPEELRDSLGEVAAPRVILLLRAFAFAENLD